MQTNNHKIVDYDAVLDAKFGKEGTSSRIEAEEQALAFFAGQIVPYFPINSSRIVSR